MTSISVQPAAITQPTSQDIALSGCWTARSISGIEHQLASVHVPSSTQVIADGARIDALDTAGAWVLQKLLLRLRAEGIAVTLRGLRPEFTKLLEVVAQHVADGAGTHRPQR